MRRASRAGVRSVVGPRRTGWVRGGLCEDPLIVAVRADETLQVSIEDLLDRRHVVLAPVGVQEEVVGAGPRTCVRQQMVQRYPTEVAHRVTSPVERDRD